MASAGKLETLAQVAMDEDDDDTFDTALLLSGVKDGLVGLLPPPGTNPHTRGAEYQDFLDEIDMKFRQKEKQEQRAERGERRMKRRKRRTDRNIRKRLNEFRIAYEEASGAFEEYEGDDEGEYDRLEKEKDDAYKRMTDYENLTGLDATDYENSDIFQ